MNLKSIVKHHFLFLTGGIIILSVMVSGCLKMTIKSDLNPATNFSKYRTFAWEKRNKSYYHVDQKFDTDVIENSIIQHANNELFRRGYAIDTLQPDLILSFSIATEGQVKEKEKPIYSATYTPYYYGNTTFYDNGGGAGGSVVGWEPVYINYEEGTLVLTIKDRTTKAVLWRASADGVLDDPKTFEDELPKDIKAMFRKYPVRLARGKKV